MNSGARRQANGRSPTLDVEGLTSAQIGEMATQDRLTVHELTPVLASLEDAFMELTHDAVEYRSSVMATSGGK